MANDPKAPERVWIIPGYRLGESMLAAPMLARDGEPGGVEFIRADLCASPLPPPGSEGEAEMVERAWAAYKANVYPHRRGPVKDAVKAALRAALAPASGEARPHKESEG